MRRKPGVHETARRTGLSPAHISKIFSGSRMPSLAAAALIASARRQSLDSLYRELVELHNGPEQPDGESGKDVAA